MANVVLLIPRESDAAALSGGSWVSTLPVSNLQDPQPTYLARSTDATLASTQFDVDAGAALDWDGFVLVRTDFSTAAQLEVVVNTTQVGLDTPAATSGAMPAWPVSGRPTRPPGKVWFDVFKRFSLGAWRWRRVKLVDTANPGGRVNVGRLVWGKVWQPTRNYSYGIDRAIIPADLRIITPSGHTLGDPGLRARQWNVPFNFATQADAEENLEDLLDYCGQARDVFVCLDPEAATTLHRQMMLATLEGVTRVVRVKSKVWQFTVSLRERI